MYYDEVRAENNPKRKKVIIYTDPGRDVDDVTMFTYLEQLQREGEIAVVGIVVLHMVPEIRARITRLMQMKFGRHVPIAEGSEYPLCREGDQDLLREYLEEHKLRGHSFEGLGLEGYNPHKFLMFRTPNELLYNALEAFPGEINILCVGPMTDLAKTILFNKEILQVGGVQGLYIQGNAEYRGSRLTALETGYNLKCDMVAAQIVFDCLPKIPKYFLGKETPYAVALGDEYKRWGETDSAVGKYLHRTAVNGLTAFALRDPELYSQIYADGKVVDENDPIKDAKYLSMPYDPMTAMFLTYPELFSPRAEGNCQFVGQEGQGHCLRDPLEAKEVLVSCIDRCLALRDIPEVRSVVGY